MRIAGDTESQLLYDNLCSVLDKKVPRQMLSERYATIQSPEDQLYNYIMFLRNPFDDLKTQRNVTHQNRMLSRHYYRKVIGKKYL